MPRNKKTRNEAIAKDLLGGKLTIRQIAIAHETSQVNVKIIQRKIDKGNFHYLK